MGGFTLVGGPSRQRRPGRGIVSCWLTLVRDEQVVALGSTLAPLDSMWDSSPQNGSTKVLVFPCKHLWKEMAS